MRYPNTLTGTGGHRHGQSTLEYAVIIAVVATALMAMSTYVRRSVQANLKMIEEQINAEVVE